MGQLQYGGRMEETIIFKSDDGEEIELYVIEQTTLNGRSYILVAEDSDDDEEATAYIMREKTVEAEGDSDDAVYEFVEDEQELGAVAGVFEALVEDCDITLED